MQAKLPDVNAAIVRHRNHVITCMQMSDWYGAAVSLGSINALLPEDYRLEIDAKKYEETIKVQTYAICRECGADIPRGDVKPVDIYLPSFEQLVLGSQYAKKWLCPKCDKWNDLRETDFKNVSLAQPSFIGVIPPPPVRKPGLQDRQNVYSSKMRFWLGIAFPEIENKIGKYRADYAAQNDDEAPMIPDEEL